jgi:putative glutathione S-transferase
MSMLVDGKWQKTPMITGDAKGNFVRADSAFRQKITADGSSGFKAEPNRYHLYVSYACPWASRTIIFRTLKGLEHVISLSTVDPWLQENGWAFGAGEMQDPINHAKYLYEIYQKADAHFTGKVTVPVLWDKVKQTIVNNESAEIIRMLNSEFSAYAKNNTDYYPPVLQKQIDEINDFIYPKINNGVYKTGFATTQQAYETAFDVLFSALDVVEKRLSQHRYLIDNQLTEADWRLFTTLIRFDVVYCTHFKCNLRRIDDYPNLSNYVRDLYQMPGIKQTVNFQHIKEHYFKSHPFINPTGIVAKGPAIDFNTPHNREKLFS